LLLVAACGSSSTSKTTDAAVDSHPFPPIDAPPMAQGTHSHYVVDKVNVPTTNMQARMYGLDLNGDGSVDNNLGMVMSTLASMGADLQGLTDHAVDTGTILMLADVQTTAFDHALSAGFTTYVGQNPMPAPCASAQDTVCRHHLTGTGTFDVAAMPRDPALVGDFVASVYTGGPGHLPIEVTFLGNMPVTFDLIGAKTQLSGSATAITNGILAGCVTENDINTKVYPGLAASFTADIAANCTMLQNPPSCGCASGSTEATLLSLFDTNHDCAISASEISSNSLVMSLFAPDLTIEGQQCISFGVGFTAVPGTFTP
jgi:hypothetical protein